MVYGWSKLCKENSSTEDRKKKKEKEAI